MSKSLRIVSRQAGLEIDELKGKNSLALVGGFADGSRFYLSIKLSLDVMTERMPFVFENYLIFR